jgi:hypothetical protein
MAIPRWASESAGNGAQPVVGGDTRLRSRPELSGHSGRARPAIRRMISLPLVVVVVEGQRYLVSMLGAEVGSGLYRGAPNIAFHWTRTKTRVGDGWR